MYLIYKNDFIPIESYYISLNEYWIDVKTIHDLYETDFKQLMFNNKLKIHAQKQNILLYDDKINLIYDIDNAFVKTVDFVVSDIIYFKYKLEFDFYKYMEKSEQKLKIKRKIGIFKLKNK